MPGEFPPRTERPQLTRADVEERLGRGEHLEGVSLVDLDLAGLELRGKRFCESDVWGLQLHRSADETTLEVTTDIRDTDWTDAAFASIGQETFFGRVNAEGATFGFTETLAARRQRHAASGQPPSDRDSGSYHNFNGIEGNFRRTTWRNIDFGGGTGYDALFTEADLTDAVIDGCNLGGLDLTTATITGMEFRDGCWLRGMRIRADQMEAVLSGYLRGQGREVTQVAPDVQRQVLEEDLGIVVED